MNAYVCVYRHKQPSPREQKKTRSAAETHPALEQYLDEYDDSFYDWGDDPAFFAAEWFMGDVRRASWGVCRRNVRSYLNKGDLVVFFCAKESSKAWDYYYVGFGTVDRLIRRQSQRPIPKELKPYSEFFNLLVSPKSSEVRHKEIIHNYHKDWKNRISAPYIIFDLAEELTNFNLCNPLRVATYGSSGGVQERWQSQKSDLVKNLEELLFEERNIDRRLRTSHSGNAHPHINLFRWRGRTRPGRNLPKIRQALLDISEQEKGPPR